MPKVEIKSKFTIFRLAKWIIFWKKSYLNYLWRIKRSTYPLTCISNCFERIKINTFLFFQMEPTLLEYIKSHSNLGISDTFEPSSWSDFKHFPGLIFMDPKAFLKKRICCPVDGSNLLDSDLWTDSSNSAYKPRLIYSINRNYFLVSKRYLCSSCSKYYAAHNEHILRQVFTDVPSKFVLFKKRGITSDLLNFLVNSVVTGKSCCIEIIYASINRF